jgi:AmpE protein
VAVTIILICLAIQRWWAIDSHQRNMAWFESYFFWIKDRFSTYQWWPTEFGVLAIIAPALILYILIAALVYHLLTMVGYYVLALVVLWYALDARPFATDNPNQKTAQQLLTNAYQHIFALIFWLLILGSTGVVLYALIAYLCQVLEELPEDQTVKNLLSYTRMAQAVLDWVPLRLLGLTYALVGHFSATFSGWYQHLFDNFMQSRQQTALCGLTSLGLPTDIEIPTTEQIVALEGLVNRSLWVWLVIIALFTIGRWIG